MHQPEPDEDGEAQVLMRGAVIVRVRGALPGDVEAPAPLSPELVAALADEEGMVRISAAEILGRLGEGKAEVIGALVAADLYGFAVPVVQVDADALEALPDGAMMRVVAGERAAKIIIG